MADKKPKTDDNFYKGYDLKWLERNPDHPDYYLVEEAKNGKSE